MNEPLRLPAPNLFQARAARFRQLARTHSSLVGYLSLIADLAGAQHGVWESCAPAAAPNSPMDGPPLDFAAWPRDPAWREGLRCIAERLDSGGGPLAALCGRIRQAADADLETWAEALLNAAIESLDPGLAPLVAAALQTCWTSRAAGLDARNFSAIDSGSRCPLCGAWPVASLLQSGGTVQGLRYLHCWLCSTEWHRPRIQCIHCGSAEHVAYFGIEGAGEAVKAEACGACNTYVKIMNREKEPRADPFADDLASLALDLLMAEEGYERFGFNPFLIPSG